MRMPQPRTISPTPLEVLAALDEAIDHYDRRDRICSLRVHPSMGRVTAEAVAKQFGPEIGTDWYARPENWRPSESAIAYVAAQLRKLTANGLAVREVETRYGITKAAYVVTAEGDLELSDQEAA